MTIKNAVSRLEKLGFILNQDELAKNNIYNRGYVFTKDHKTIEFTEGTLGEIYDNTVWVHRISKDSKEFNMRSDRKRCSLTKALLFIGETKPKAKKEPTPEPPKLVIIPEPEQIISEYDSHRAEKAERYSELSNKHTQQSESRYNSNNINTLRGMAGEPVKIGHHSESRHRNLIKKANNDMRKSIEHQETASYYTDKAAATLTNTAISSDDSKAVDKLTAKLEHAQAQHKEFVIYNKACRVTGHADKVLPAYRLSNSNQNINSMKKRLEILKANVERENKEYQINGVDVMENADENRFQILFDDIPSKEVRVDLKSYGFKWSKYNQAWQRHLNNSALYAAKAVLEKHFTS